MLTKNQLFTLEYERNKYKTPLSLIATLKSWGHIVTEQEIGEDIQGFITRFIAKHKRDYYLQSQAGTIQTQWTPTSKTEWDTLVKTPIIGRRYHLSWAYKGAKFKLIKIEGDTIYLDNPKHKRAELLKAKLSELRELKGRIINNHTT